MIKLHSIQEEGRLEIDGVEYLVLTDEQRHDKLVEICEEELDMFNKDFIMDCIDEEETEKFFREAYTEWNEGYASDIESEEASNSEYDNRLEEEMAEADVETMEDFVEWMTDQQINEGNYGLEHYILNFGEDQAFQIIKDNDLIDFEYMAEEASNIDGYGHFFNHNNGEEIEFKFDGVTYYAYEE